MYKVHKQDEQRMLKSPEIYNKYDDPEALTYTKDENIIRLNRFSLSKRDTRVNLQSAGTINSGFVGDDDKGRHKNNKNISDLSSVT